MSKSRRTQLLLGTALAALAATGCSKQLPTSPIVENQAMASPAAMTAQRPAPSILRQPPPGPGTGSRASVRMLGKNGGSATNGVFTVVVPPGTFSGQAVVTITQVDPTTPEVTLDIQPASKNHFRKTVTLIAQFSNVDASQIASSTVSEFDPASGTWSVVSGSSNDATEGTVKAPLAHFSTYRVEFPGPTVTNPTPGMPGGKGGN